MHVAPAFEPKFVCRPCTQRRVKSVFENQKGAGSPAESPGPPVWPAGTVCPLARFPFRGAHAAEKTRL